ncbi:MAG: methyltransferase domain-containing protein [Spirochaetota bacterium]
MEYSSCVICGNSSPSLRFRKQSEDGEVFSLVKCGTCGLEFVNPRPTIEDIGKYYGRQYFTRRSDRGYNNYFSSELRGEIERVLGMNLADLDFFSYEEEIPGERFALDIGCAAGYFVAYLCNRGWQAEGIDISQDCVNFAVNSLQVPVQQGNVLEATFTKTFHLVTLWATIEHLHHPQDVLQKAWDLLKPGGYLYISTCRTGPFSFQSIKGKNWRFYNFPQHLYFFNGQTLGRLLSRYGFEKQRFRTYGSGTGKPGSIARKITDFSARYLYLGDMMLVSARKPFTVSDLPSKKRRQ